MILSSGPVFSCYKCTLGHLRSQALGISVGPRWTLNPETTVSSLLHRNGSKYINCISPPFCLCLPTLCPLVLWPYFLLALRSPDPLIISPSVVWAFLGTTFLQPLHTFLWFPDTNGVDSCCTKPHLHVLFARSLPLHFSLCSFRFLFMLVGAHVHPH